MKIYFIIGWFQNKWNHRLPCSYETDALNIDFLITAIVRRHSGFFFFFLCHKFDFKQSKKLLARKFYICLCLKLKPQELKG